MSAVATDPARRLRWFATGLLVAMAGLVLIARELHWEWVRAFAEAAMVGGLADWFAVTALFRRPMGLPIPHTAIIPANRDRIADSMAGFLEAHFLTPSVVVRRIGALNPAAALGRLLAAGPRERAGRSALAEVLADARLGEVIRPALGTELARLDLAPLLAGLLRAIIADGGHRVLVARGLEKAGRMLEANEALLRGLIAGRADNIVLRLTGLDEKLANAILDGLYRLLAAAVAEPAHPLRARIEQWLEESVSDLAHDPATRARVAALWATVLANPAIARWLDLVWEQARGALLAPAPAGLDGFAGRMREELAGALTADVRLQRPINRLLRRMAAGLAARHGDTIASLVSATVKRWDPDTLTGRLESAVGPDLQFIRLNGTLVGGLVGVVLHKIFSLW